MEAAILHAEALAEDFIQGFTKYELQRQRLHSKAELKRMQSTSEEHHFFSAFPYTGLDAEGRLEVLTCDEYQNRRKHEITTTLEVLDIQAQIEHWGEDEFQEPDLNRILALDPIVQSELIRVAIQQKHNSVGWAWKIHNAVEPLFRSHLPYTPTCIQAILLTYRTERERYGTWLPPHNLIRNLLVRIKHLDVLETLRSDLEAFWRAIDSGARNTQQRKLLNLIEGALKPSIELLVRIPDDDWGTQAKQSIQDLQTQQRDIWMVILHHTRSADGPAPKQAWLNTMKRHIEAFGEASYQVMIIEWLGFLKTFSTNKQKHNHTWPDGTVGVIHTQAVLIHEENATTIKGLIWGLQLIAPSEQMARVLTQTVEHALRKVPGLGPRIPKVANAAVHVLQNTNAPFAVGQLAKLKARVTFRTTLKEIEKALEENAKRFGISKEDLEEISAPTFGLNSNGEHIEILGNYKAELRLENNGSILTFFDANGKKLKSAPTSMKHEFANGLKDLKAVQKDITGMLGAIKARIEKLHISQKTWTFEQWQDRYLTHPLVGQVARRLIWNIDGTAIAIHPEQGLVGVHGQKFKFDLNAPVSLWHPIKVSTTEVLEWRAWLEAANIQQPWKQAHREVYVLTAAEERSRLYSNRFASHIIKQHQFSQLTAVRGWNNQLRLSVDARYTPAMLELPEWNLRAEYWIEGIGEHGVDTTDVGTYLRLATDQVRFYSLNAPLNHAQSGSGQYAMWLQDKHPLVEPIPLDQVPAIVLSEVFRDVDLFVGVTSVGNDPTWQDGGPNGQFRDYWQHYSFGDLNATAITRKEILETLLPRLKIRDRASFDGKFLKIRGDLRTYKIHLGSSNILMEPNDQYLCIVPSARVELNNIKLPFDGDQTLAVILSKAFMLAEDTAITDPTITQQINSR
jgi:Domain of unknown function (DUF4132)